MQKLLDIAKAILDKVDQLLTTEPARVIGYGAAFIVYAASAFLASKGIIDVKLTFEQSVGAAFGAVGTLIILVESIRRFVYSPQTYIENLSDEAAAAHEAAHLEEAFKVTLDAIQRAANEATTTAAPAPAPAVKGKSN